MYRIVLRAGSAENDKSGGKMKIAVTGAFSYSGKYITKRLLARGEEVITLTNHPNRPDPFVGKVKAFPLNFENPAELENNLRGVDVLVNTYWVRFDKGSNTQPQAVKNTKTGRCRRESGREADRSHQHRQPIRRFAPALLLGQSRKRKSCDDSGASYAILRPTVLVGGGEDILINNIAFLLRRFPFFFIPGDGSYGIQPVHVEDLADLAVEGVYSKENYVIDAVGPDSYTFKELVQLVGETIGAKRPLISVPPRLALFAAQFLSLFVNDVILTPEEVDGLMANLLVSHEPARGKTIFKDWLKENRETVGAKYASELKRHYS
jgi:uncharacterized protein YbjT (DUF2867 family)